MKITRRQLRQIIKEEFRRTLREADDGGGWFEMSIKSSKPEAMVKKLGKKDSSHWGLAIKRKMGSPGGLNVKTVKVSLMDEVHGPSPAPHLHVSVELGEPQDPVDEGTMQEVTNSVLSALGSLLPGRYLVSSGPTSHMGHSHGSQLSHR